ncbi:MAG: pyridoxamine 5'-phosphate oxidase family protein [Myxococcota bacterium]
MSLKGPWSRQEIDRFLDDTRVPLRLACHGASGFPVLASLWFVRHGDLLWCATRPSARVVTLLGRDPRCAFEVAQETAPYRGVRGQGRAELSGARGAEILGELVDRYLGSDDSEFARWLLARADGEVAIAIEPSSRVSWDFSDRMAGAA